MSTLFFSIIISMLISTLYYTWTRNSDEYTISGWIVICIFGLMGYALGTYLATIIL